MSNHVPSSEELEILALVQARIVSEIFAQRSAKTIRAGIDRLVMKGGMAMREAHNQYRHTSDIDLDADPDQLSLEALQKIVEKALKESFADDDFKEVTITTPKMTDTVARWKWKIVLENGMEIVGKVECSFRNNVEPSSFRTIEHDDGVAIPVYHDEFLLMSKAKALYTRKEGVLRDAADLYVLFSAGVMPSPAQMLKIWNVEEIERLHSLVVRQARSQDDGWILQRLDKWGTDEKRFNDQILAFWGNDNPPTDMEWMEMCLFVAEKLEVMWGQALQENALQNDEGAGSVKVSIDSIKKNHGNPKGKPLEAKTAKDKIKGAGTATKTGKGMNTCG